MSKSIALAARPLHNAPLQTALRFVLVSGCATALIMARYPLPF